MRLKLPLTAALVAILVLLKGQLGGTMTFFSMVGVFAAYEARKSLWTMGRQNTIVIMFLTPMMALIYAMYPLLDIGGALVAGWIGFALAFAALRALGIIASLQDRELRSERNNQHKGKERDRA
ncbi:hypothetical protein [Paenibacillus sp. MBLB4367]|uniref:hypothetical protein n=1 Tax=Paenibacillus sp. MBLB4367 TaxID=3384767 RepID=UPI003907F2ED